MGAIKYIQAHIFDRCRYSFRWCLVRRLVARSFGLSFTIIIPFVNSEHVPHRDTVDSVGLIPRRLPFTTSNTIIRTFRQALSLDEHRANFKANVWNHPNEEDAQVSLPKAPQRATSHKTRRTYDNVVNVDYDGNEEIDAYEQRYSSLRKEATDVYEVWFAGCHCGAWILFIYYFSPHITQLL